MSEMLNLVNLRTPYGCLPQIRIVEYFWPNGKTKYRCFHNNLSAVETEVTWSIVKYTIDGKRQESYRTGRVDSEGVVNALSWTI